MSLRENNYSPSNLEDQVEYVDDESVVDLSENEKKRKKEIKQMEEDFSGDEEDYEEVWILTDYSYVDEA